MSSLAAVQLHSIHPLRSRSNTLKAMLEDTADLLDRLNYGDPNSNDAARIQVMAIRELLTT